MKNKSANVLPGSQDHDALMMDTISSVNLTDARERSDVPLVLRRFIFMSVAAATFFINGDMGAFAPALLKM